MNRQKRVAIFSSRMGLNNPLDLAVGEAPQIHVSLLRALPGDGRQP